MCYFHNTRRYPVSKGGVICDGGIQIRSPFIDGQIIKLLISENKALAGFIAVYYEERM